MNIHEIRTCSREFIKTDRILIRSIENFLYHPKKMFVLYNFLKDISPTLIIPNSLSVMALTTANLHRNIKGNNIMHYVLHSLLNTFFYSILDPTNENE